MKTGLKKAVTNKLLEASFLHLSIFAGKPHDKAATSPNREIAQSLSVPFAGFRIAYDGSRDCFARWVVNAPVMQ
jgi:hypothetical protein